MNRDELIQRINEALDSPDGLEGDLELQRIFVRDSDASDLADQLAGIDGSLRGWPAPARSEEGWNALATRIEQRLGEALPPMADPTAPPRFEDPKGPQLDRPQVVIREKAGAGMSGTSGASEREGPRATSTPTTPDEDRFSFSDLAVAPPRSAGGAPFLDVAGQPRSVTPSRRTGLWLGGGLAAAAAVGLAVVVGTASLSGDEEAVASGPASGAVSTARGGPGAGEWEDPAPAQEAIEDRAQDQVRDVTQEQAEPAEWADEEVTQETLAEEAEPASRQEAQRSGLHAEGSPSPRARRASVGSGAADRTAQRRAAASPAPSRAAEESARTAQVAGAGGMASAGAGGSAGAESLPETPSREQIVQAMNGIEPLVESCSEERSGVVSVDITVASSGRVRSAVVTGYFAGTPEGSCVARAVRRARLPQFTRETFSFTYPFRI